MPKRQSIYSDAFSHGNPIPAACRVGDLLMTGTPEGVGPIVPGDVIDARIDGIGAMQVKVR